MGERKVLNKYYPPDFDPTLLPRNRKPRDRQIEVRIMIPFTLCCSMCKEFSYRGKKFNSKKEIAQDVTYLGIHIHRFFIKCPRCASEIVFRTDPEHADYILEHGATRNYEVWNDRRGEDEDEDENDVMKALEKKTHDNKIEMDILDALDDAKTLNARHQKVDMDKVLEKLRKEQESGDARDKIELDDEEEELVEQTEFEKNVRRISEDEEKARERERELVMAATKAAITGGVQAQPKRLAGVLVKRKAEEAADGEGSAKGQKTELAGLLGGYSSSSSD